MSTHLTLDEVMKALKIDKTNFHGFQSEGNVESLRIGREHRGPSELLGYVANQAATTA